MLRIFFGLLILCWAAHAEQSSFTQAQNKAETTRSEKAKSSDIRQAPAPFPFWMEPEPVPPLINVYTAKQTDKKSECTKPENWNEWIPFAWCRSVEWLDPEKTIAIFTVILGIATGFLWWATRNLVIDAKETSGRQLRAYISANPLEIVSADQEERFVQITFQVKNHGQTPAGELHYIFGFDVFPNPSPEGFCYPAPTIPIHADNTLFPQGEMTVWFNFNRLLSTEEFAAVEQDGLRLHIWGTIFYRTAFEKHGQCRTDFRASVGGPAFVATLRAHRRKQAGPGFKWTWEAGHGSGN